VYVYILETTTAKNSTIGILVYVNPINSASGLDRTKIVFQRVATSILLAVHHINTQDATVVGADTLSQLPPSFGLKYKIADTHSDQSEAVKAFLNWQNEEGNSIYSCATADTVNNSSHQIEHQPMYQANPLDEVSAIVGPFRSQESQAVSDVSAALGMKNFPVTSYASSSSDLSDKVRYPHFSRTTPDLHVQAAGIVKFLNEFHWKKCALLYVDDPWGNSFATSFLSQAGLSRVLVLVSQKFQDGDANAIGKAVRAAKFSSARIFVFLEDTGNNLEQTLLSARDEGIAGQDGYAWITFEQNDPEVQLNVKRTPKEELRPLLFGWINLFSAGPSEADRLRYEAIFSSANQTAVYNPVVDMPSSGFVRPTTGFLLTAIDTFAYDAVWATALGIARMKADGSDLVQRIRESQFRGASGLVAFNNLTGDRAADGLKMLVNNIQAGSMRRGQFSYAQANWSGTPLVSTQVGIESAAPALETQRAAAAVA
jgi:hypothetical protein